MADCIDCKHAYPLKDNRGKYHSICICAESDAFLHPVSLVFVGCDHCAKDEEEL